MLLPRGAEALGVSVAFVIAASLLDGTHTLSVVQKALPVHYWQNWTNLVDSSDPAHLTSGIVAQIATIALAGGVALLVLCRRDPAA
ncbi:hypothetical protein [Actinacidiphila paucisporea]|uniref:Uncharacterized protein n=1 Tax=Actinacidiphila paucisporea TaxID=310782 RepID=A0A1M7QWA8_9ACTN|nr:hypothetical protein [Actinacidiphila paucisporea]SHN35930.1 hypothetical protein SAMN05216499_1453 [Actinacidiphila paucisporea]